MQGHCVVSFSNENRSGSARATMKNEDTGTLYLRNMEGA